MIMKFSKDIILSDWYQIGKIQDWIGFDLM